MIVQPELVQEDQFILSALDALLLLWSLLVVDGGCTFAAVWLAVAQGRSFTRPLAAAVVGVHNIIIIIVARESVGESYSIVVITTFLCTT